MGSSGNGMFGTYRGGGAGSIVRGGNNGGDECPLAIENILLELYTDCGIFTCNEAIGEDATAVFNMLSGYSEPLSWNELVLAPIWLRTRFMRLIARETKHAREGKPARIVAKMNSLCDEGIIAALYEASAAGVKWGYSVPRTASRRSRSITR